MQILLNSPVGCELQCEDEPFYCHSMRGARAEGEYSRAGGEADLRRGRPPQGGERSETEGVSPYLHVRL